MSDYNKVYKYQISSIFAQGKRVLIIFKMEIEIGYVKLHVPHERSTLTLQWPAFRGRYGNVAEQIDTAGLKRPTSPEIASLMYDAFKNKKREYESKVIQALNPGVWEFTGNLYLPKSREEVNNGVIIESNPKIANGILVMDKGYLIKRLQENDPLVNFVPFGFKIGEQSVRKLQKNPYIIARYGEEGAEKIAEIASKYNQNPELWSFDSVDEEETWLSALNSDWDDGRLYVSSGIGYIGDSFAFGVFAPEKSK